MFKQLMLALVMSVVAADPPNNQTPMKLRAWVNQDCLTGTLTFLMLTFFFYAGWRALASVDVPAYQIQAQDPKKNENVREWS